VRILDPDEKLLPDMSARITFLADQPKGEGSANEPHAVLVDPDAIKRSSQGDSFVWVVTDGRVRRVLVETTGQVGERVRISKGLNGGEALVTSDVALDENDRVKATKP
jgi:multidrug efflux pump subunit AcrA (membrane-fusion protein)